MATTDVERLLVRLEANLTQYEKAFAKAHGTTVSSMRKIEREVQASATRVEGSFAKMGGVIKNFGKGLLIGAGITGLGAFGAFVQDTISQAAKIGDLADKLGLGTDSLQALQAGAVQADMTFEDLDKTLLRFSKTLGEAANGQGEYLKTLRANGQQLQGSFLGNLRQLADLVKNAKNEQEALLIITQAMGKGSDGWLEVLKKGSSGLTELERTSKAAGDQLNDAVIRRAQEIDDRWAALMHSLSQMTKSWVLESVSEIDKVFNAIDRVNKAQNAGGRAGARTGPQYVMKAPGTPLGAPPPPDYSNETIRAAPGAGTVQPVTKVANPDKEAEDKRKKAEADRLAAQALRELNREREREADAIERQFEAFTGELTRTDEEIAAMHLEAETLGLSTAEIERQRMAQELLNAANSAGIPITAELNAVIQQKAQAYGDAAQALEDMRVRQERIDEINSSAQDSITSFITDIAHGVEPVEALTDALSNLADQLLQIAMNQALTGLFDSKNGGGVGGAIAALVNHRGGVVGSGGGHRLVSPAAFVGARRMHRGGLAGDEVPTILQKGEIVLPRGFRMPGGQSRNVTNIYTPPGMRAERRESQQSGGVRREDIYLVFDDYMASGRGQRTMGAIYGATPRQKRR